MQQPKSFSHSDLDLAHCLLFPAITNFITIATGWDFFGKSFKFSNEKDCLNCFFVILGE